MFETGNCGTCKYHFKDNSTGEWTCGCPDSENYGIETGYNDSCDEHEERE